MKKFYIIRHGQSQSNAGGEAMPNAQIPLTALGHEQAVEVAEWILSETKSNIDSIGISEYIRTQLTAQPLLDKTGMQARVIPNLQEFNQLCFLKIDGKSVEDRQALLRVCWQEKTPDYIDGADEFSSEENNEETRAESFIMFADRANKVLAQLHDIENGTHVLYSHGMLMSMLIWRILNQPIDSQKAMQNFRDFELSIRPKNTEVYLLQLQDDTNALPAITKVRTID